MNPLGYCLPAELPSLEARAVNPLLAPRVWSGKPHCMSSANLTAILQCKIYTYGADPTRAGLHSHWAVRLRLPQDACQRALFVVGLLAHQFLSLLIALPQRPLFHCPRFFFSSNERQDWLPARHSHFCSPSRVSSPSTRSFCGARPATACSAQATQTLFSRRLVVQRYWRHPLFDQAGTFDC